MAERIVTYQTTNGQREAKRRLRDIFGTINYFTVGVGGQATFTGLVDLVAADQRLDVYVNGHMMKEGASDDYQRDFSLQRISFNYTVPQDAQVKIIVYL